jgi:formamidopyrimidine-DNA glycosylase
MAGTRIRRTVLRRGNLRYPFPDEFAQRLQGQLVRSVSRRAKYLVVELGSGDALLMHLGMSGSFRVARDKAMGRRGVSLQADNPAEAGLHDTEPHDHVIFELTREPVPSRRGRPSGRPEKIIVVFNDPRRFGFMTIVPADEMTGHAALARLGPEPLARTFDAAALARTFARRKTSLKAVLSDQRVVAGLGNIYVSEALHRARLSPKRVACTLVTRGGKPRPALHDLVASIRDVLKLAIRNQYRTGADDPFLVYDHEGERCPRRGCGGTIRRIVQAGRSTFYCPGCQR